MAEMKAEGMEYDQRMEELEKLEYPKPLQEFVYTTFNAFADRHPWVGGENIRPKSIAREMFEQFRSFAEYVLDYDLQRVEGLLLRHLNSVYKVLAPDGARPGEDRRPVRDGGLPAHDAARGRLEPRRRVGADEGPRVPAARAAGRAAIASRPPGAPDDEPDVTRDARKFTASVRTRIFTFLRAWSIGDQRAALAALDWQDDEDEAPWGTDRLQELFDAYRAEHQLLRLDPEARNLRHTHIDHRGTGVSASAKAAADSPKPAGEGGPPAWRVTQVLVDPEMENDWAAVFDVDLAKSREAAGR